MSRSDRRAADLIEAAFRQGARLDAWSEHLNFPAWERAIAETGFDTADALRERRVEERLPWDHLDVHIPKSWFAEDWARALVLQHAADCRHSKCHKCGVIDVKRPLCASMLRTSIAGAKEEKTWVRPPLPAPENAVGVHRIRFRVGRVERARFLSHLETASAWHRSLRRAKLPLAWSDGFHPHPKVNFSSALPVGEESIAEYMDVVLTAPVEAEEALARLRAVVPPDFMALGALAVDLRAEGLMNLVEAVDYTLTGEVPEPSRIDAALAAETLFVERASKRGPIQLDIRPMIRGLARLPDGRVEARLQTVDGRPGKAKDILALLGMDPTRTRILRTDVYVRGPAGLVAPIPTSAEPAPPRRPPVGAADEASAG